MQQQKERPLGAAADCQVLLLHLACTPMMELSLPCAIRCMRQQVNLVQERARTTCCSLCVFSARSVLTPCESVAVLSASLSMACMHVMYWVHVAQWIVCKRMVTSACTVDITDDDGAEDIPAQCLALYDTNSDAAYTHMQYVACESPVARSVHVLLTSSSRCSQN